MVSVAEQIKENGECFSLSDLAVKGNDFKSFLSGKKVGEALDDCLNAVIEEKIPNEKNALIDYAKKVFDSKDFVVSQNKSCD